MKVVAFWQTDLLCYMTQLHCNVHCGVPNANHDDRLSYKVLRTFILPTVEVAAFKLLNAWGGKRECLVIGGPFPIADSTHRRMCSI